MPLLLSLLGNWRTWAILAYVGLAGALWLQTHRLESSQGRERALQAQLDVVAELGRQAEAKNKVIVAAQQKAKEKADAERVSAKVKLDGLYAAYGSLRDARERSGGSFLPAPAPGAADSARASFDRSGLDNALRGFDRGVTGLLREGDEALNDLATAKNWAQKSIPR